MCVADFPKVSRSHSMKTSLVAFVLALSAIAVGQTTAPQSQAQPAGSQPAATQQPGTAPAAGQQGAEVVRRISARHSRLASHSKMAETGWRFRRRLSKAKESVDRSAEQHCRIFGSAAQGLRERSKVPACVRRSQPE